MVKKRKKKKKDKFTGTSHNVPRPGNSIVAISHTG